MVLPSAVLLAQAAKRVSRLRPRKAALVLTDRAVDRIKMLLDKRHKVRQRERVDNVWRDHEREGAPGRCAER